MDYLIGLLHQLTGDSRQTQWLFLALVAAGTFALGLSGMLVLTALLSPMRRRVAAVSGARERANPLAQLGKAAEPLADYLLPKTETERTAVRMKLIHAGYRSGNAIHTYYAMKTLLAITLPLCVLAGLHWLPVHSAMKMALYLVGAAALGLILPSYWLDKAVAPRQRTVSNGLPDALDLLVVCTEAGYGLKQALARVSDEIAVSHSELGEELALVNAEMRAGVETSQSLRNLADRTGLDDIHGLVALLGQSLKFGTSVAHALRVYADDFRDRRMQRAEERAATIGTRMIFPLILCIFPSFFLVTVGPPLVGVLAMFGRM